MKNTMHFMQIEEEVERFGAPSLSVRMEYDTGRSHPVIPLALQGFIDHSTVPALSLIPSLCLISYFCIFTS